MTSFLEAPPSARRIATSFWRPRPRAARRFATLAQAMRSTRPTIAIRDLESGVLVDSRKRRDAVVRGGQHQLLGQKRSAKLLGVSPVKAARSASSIGLKITGSRGRRVRDRHAGFQAGRGCGECARSSRHNGYGVRSCRLSWPSGRRISGLRPTLTPKNPRGVTPMMVISEFISRGLFSQ